MEGKADPQPPPPGTFLSTRLELHKVGCFCLGTSQSRGKGALSGCACEVKAFLVSQASGSFHWPGRLFWMA